jgi:hypothetical protein
MGEEFSAPFSHRLASVAMPNALQSSQKVNFYDIFSSLSLCNHFGAQNTGSKPFAISSLHFSVGEKQDSASCNVASLRGPAFSSSDIER